MGRSQGGEGATLVEGCALEPGRPLRLLHCEEAALWVRASYPYLTTRLK